MSEKELCQRITAKCEACKGASTVEKFGKRVRCSTCKGTGRRLTDRQVLDEIATWGRSIREEDLADARLVLIAAERVSSEAARAVSAISKRLQATVKNLAASKRETPPREGGPTQAR
jgi:hypothetical protein